MIEHPEILELAAASYCFHPAAPMPGLLEVERGQFVLTDAGQSVASKLCELAAAALKSDAGMGAYRPLLFLVWRAFGASDGEGVVSAASMLAATAEELLFEAAA